MKINSKTRSVSTSIMVLFFLTFVISSYFFSYGQNEISGSLFTISQSLAFGNKILMISLLSIAFLLLIYLNYLVCPKEFVLKISPLLVIFGLIISIMFVTTYYNRTDHYILAGIIFFLSLIYICYNSYVLNKLITNKIYRTINYGLPPASILIIIGLLVSNISTVSNDASYLFPSFENAMLAMMGVSVFLLGWAY